MALSFALMQTTWLAAVPEKGRSVPRAQGGPYRTVTVLLIGTTKFLRERPRHFWANVHPGGEWKFEWVQEFYFADFGQIVVQDLSAPVGKELEVLTSDSYYKGVIGLDGRGLRVPDDLDESICRYQSLPAALQAKFDRAAYWLSMAARQWEDSMSASYASLVAAAEALTPDDGTTHYICCVQCGQPISPSPRSRNDCPTRGPTRSGG
jgi:hypothetical protein